MDETELRELLRSIDPRNQMGLKAEELLDLLDPFSNDIITFSSIVTLLSSQLVNVGGKQLSVLHKISLEA